MKLKMNLWRQNSNFSLIKLCLYALHKCCYPSCVGEAAKSWIWSPFGYNILLSLFRSGTVKTDEYVQIYKALSQKPTWSTKNKLFYSSSKCNPKDLIQNVADVGLERELLDFQCSAAKESIRKWASQYENFDAFDIGSNLSPDTSFALINVTTFQDQWKVSESSGFSVKVINSFNYTVDVKYEARFLEVPLQDEDLKLIIVVPNETDQLYTVFRRLSNEGLAAALTSVQPLFAVNSRLVTPDIAICSETVINLTNGNKPIFDGSSIQYGTIKTDDTGVLLKVLTCLSPNKSTYSQRVKQLFKEDKVYFFAIIFKDIPLVTGQYLFASDSSCIL